MDLKAYADNAGKALTTMKYKVMAWRVAVESHVRLGDLRDSWRNLAEIHAAPEWLWAGLVTAMIEGGWTVATTHAEITTASVICLKRWTAWSGIQTYPQVALIHNPLYKKPPSLWITFAVAIQVALERARQPIQIWIGIALRPRARGLTGFTMPIQI